MPSHSTVTLHIDGMSCGHCVKAVSQALQDLPGVKVRKVRIGRAKVRITPEQHASVLRTIEAAGYQVRSA